MIAKTSAYWGIYNLSNAFICLSVNHQRENAQAARSRGPCRPHRCTLTRGYIHGPGAPAKCLLPLSSHAEALHGVVIRLPVSRHCPYIVVQKDTWAEEMSMGWEFRAAVSRMATFLFAIRMHKVDELTRRIVLSCMQNIVTVSVHHSLFACWWFFPSVGEVQDSIRVPALSTRKLHPAPIITTSKMLRRAYQVSSRFFQREGAACPYILPLVKSVPATVIPKPRNLSMFLYSFPEIPFRQPTKLHPAIDRLYPGLQSVVLDLLPWVALFSMPQI